MNVNIAELGDAQLIDLIQKASAELAERMATPHVERVSAPRETIILREPPAETKAFCLRLKTMLERGRYISASERAQVAKLAEEYGEWIARQGLPKEKGTKAWREAKENATIFKPAREQ
ncbi:hypothetical protein [Vreelandella sp. EE22]